MGCKITVAKSWPGNRKQNINLAAFGKEMLSANFAEGHPACCHHLVIRFRKVLLHIIRQMLPGNAILRPFKQALRKRPTSASSRSLR